MGRMGRMRNGNGLGRVGVVISKLLEGGLVVCMGGKEGDGLNGVECKL